MRVLVKSIVQQIVFIPVVVFIFLYTGNDCYAQNSDPCKEDSLQVSIVQVICLDQSVSKVSFRYFSCFTQDSVTVSSLIGMDVSEEFAIVLPRDEKIELIEPFYQSIEIPTGYDYHYLFINRKQLIHQDDTNEVRIIAH